MATGGVVMGNASPFMPSKKLFYITVFISPQGKVGMRLEKPHQGMSSSYTYLNFHHNIDNQQNVQLVRNKK